MCWSRNLKLTARLLKELAMSTTVLIVFVIETALGNKQCGKGNHEWLNELPCLIARFSHLGVGMEVATFTLDEARGLHRYLSRLAKEV